jgi:hypothetical protein
MHVAEDTEVWKDSTQMVHAVLPKHVQTTSRRVRSYVALGGAGVVILLYLIVPLMIFFSLFHDLWTQFLCALLLLAIGEFIVFGILVKTSVPIKQNSAKIQDAP